MLRAQSTVGGSGTRIEIDDSLDRTALGGQATDEEGGRQEATRELGHHAFGQRQSPAGGLPGGFERRGAGTVSTIDEASPPRGADAERARAGSADETAEERVAVEARHAHPVDGSVGRYKRCRAGVADESVVADLRRSLRRSSHFAVRRRPSAIPNAKCETIATAGVWAP